MILKSKKYRKAMLVLLPVIASQSTLVFGGTMGPSVVEPGLSPYVVTLSVGPVWTSAVDNQTIYVTPNIQKTYAANNQTHAIADGELFLGMQRALNARFQGQLGVAVGVTSRANLSGNVWDDADAAFNNFNYSYNLQHTYVAAKGKLLADVGMLIKPYVSASIGAGFNRSSGFNSTPIIFAAKPTPDFTSQTTTAFSYTLGIGLQRAITMNWHAGVGYEFSDWGKSQLNHVPNQPLGNGLSESHFYTNGLLFSLSYTA